MKQSTTLRNVVALCAITLVLLLHAGVVNAQTAKAIWCAGNTTLYFTFDDATYAAEGTYDGQTITNVWEIPVNGYNSDRSVPWYKYGDNIWGSEGITRVVIDENFFGFKPISLAYWFNSCDKVTTITGLNYINTSQATTLKNLFKSCSSLTSIDGVNNWDTSNVTDMSGVLNSCSKLTSIDAVRGWNTSNVTDMGSAIGSCSQLSSLDAISGWNTSNVTNMSNTFSNLKVSSLDAVRGWNTSNVTNMKNTFFSCSNITTLDGLENWDTGNVTDMSMTFDNCKKITKLDALSNWDTGKVTTLKSTFDDCEQLKSLAGLENWDTKNVTTLEGTFSSCSSLTSLAALSRWDIGKVTTLNSTFAFCETLKSLVGLENWNTSNVTDMSNTFYNCSAVTSVEPLSEWKTGNVKTLYQTFRWLYNLESLHGLENWNTENVTSLNSTFLRCEKLKSLEPIRNWNTSNVTGMSGTFQSCSKLESLEPIYNWNTSNNTSLNGTFKWCSSLTLVDLSGWDASKVTQVAGMFYGCSKLRGLTFGENFTLNKVDFSRTWYYEEMLSSSKLRYIDFYNCNYATSGDGLTFALNAVDRSSGVFKGVPETTVIYLPKGNGEVTDVRNVVYSYNGDKNDLRCPNYYSIDEVKFLSNTKYKVDIELPRAFKTNKAEYTRTMSTEYGSVILPYDFTTNSNIQAYTLDEEHKTYMYFKDTETVPAHTPFAFKKLGDADFTMTDATGGFGITVNATHTTSAAEGGEPYTHSENLGGWTTKGYYVNETVANDGSTFYIAGDTFYKADGDLTLYPHRVTFHGAWEKPTAAGAKEIKWFDNETTAIDAAETRMAEKNEIYDAQGRRLNTLTRGLNIIRMSDGTTRKVIRK